MLLVHRPGYVFPHGWSYQREERQSKLSVEIPDGRGKKPGQAVSLCEHNISMIPVLQQ
jgi:hypothetical protein